MARVICTLPNASERINGVAFVADRGQMLSEDISDEVAAEFAAIEGYSLVVPPARTAAATAASLAARAAKQAAPAVDEPPAS
jgi:hypothetical protein